LKDKKAEEKDLKKEIEKTLLDRGAALVGFAHMKGVTHGLGRGIISGVSIAVSLDPDILKGIFDGPTKEYYEEYKRVNEKLSRLAGAAANILRQNGYQAVEQEPSGDISRFNDLCSPMPHKTVATRAGLGWIGKTALLITPQFGSAVRLNSVLTDKEFDETADPITDSRCGDCTICVDECPGGAAEGLLWNIMVKRNDFFDAYKCHDTARERSNRAGIESTICGKCIVVCPWTKKYLKKCG
jgi:epoxyqueuosine reductase QueG